MKKNIVTIALIFITGIISFIAGNNFGKNKKIKNSTDNSIKTATTDTLDNTGKTDELRLGGYTFINPLLDCDNYHPSMISSSLQLERKVKYYIDSVISAKRASQISFYYRDLANGPWIGIGEKDDFSPASLLKVPIMIAAFKKAENEPGFLEKKIRFDKNLNSEIIPNITDSVIKIGHSYTVEKLIYYMIVHSDNNARLLLYQNIDMIFINKVFSDMDIDISNFNESKDFMSVKTYSSFFRTLYNATYLNKENSEKALQILSHSSFRQGLPALLPANVLIAHKFGERGYADSNEKQLHDCGIVYKGNTPYLICIMTKGTSNQELTKIIADISLLVYINN